MKQAIWRFTSGLVGVCACLLPASAGTWHGLYTDATSYTPGDAIKVYVSAPADPMVIRLVRLDTDWTEVARTGTLAGG